MDAFIVSQNQFLPLSPEIFPAESFSPSDSGSTMADSSCSDVEVKLASRNPKKISGRKKFKETRHPVYRGVSRRNSGRWVCEVREPNKKSRVWLGTHPTAEMAARAHDVAVLAMRGRSACLNFADSIWRLLVPETSSVKDIQKAAAAAAEAFRLVVEVVEIKESKDLLETVVIIDERKELPESVIYMDEETMFGMPAFLAQMAEGLMVLPPLAMIESEDDVEIESDVSLWSY